MKTNCHAQKSPDIFCSVRFSPSRKESGKASLESIGLKCKKEKLSWQKYPVKIKSSPLASILSIFWAGLSINFVLTISLLVATNYLPQDYPIMYKEWVYSLISIPMLISGSRKTETEHVFVRNKNALVIIPSTWVYSAILGHGAGVL